MTYPRMPAVILARQGSQRLKRKWALPWPPASGTNLVENAVRVALRCKYVDQVFVGSDSQELLERISKRFGPGSIEPNIYLPDGLNRVETVLRPDVSAVQGSMEALRWVLEQQRLQASFCLLIQATFPFLSEKDLDRLVETWQMDGRGRGMFLSRPAQPSTPAGAAWLVHPYLHYDRTSPCPATTPCYDIDTRKDYDAAVAEYRMAHPQQ